MRLHAQEPLFLSEQNVESKRYATIEEMDGSAWLYLTAPNELRPIKDAFVYSVEDPTPETDWSRVKDGFPPRVSREFASSEAVRRNVRAEDLSFQWADAGDSVAVRLRGVIIAVIVKEEQRGFSMALSKTGPLGFPLEARVTKRFEQKAAQPGATDNPDDAQHLREDH